MNRKFENKKPFSSIEFDDKGITFDCEILTKFYPYGSIEDIKFFMGTLQIIDKERDEQGRKKISTFPYKSEMKLGLKEMISWTKIQMGNAAPASAVYIKNNIDDYIKANQLSDEDKKEGVFGLVAIALVVLFVVMIMVSPAFAMLVAIIAGALAIFNWAFSNK